MENKEYIKNSDLETLFKNRIIQYDNFNSNSELFIKNNKVYKIYFNNVDYTNFNINVIKNIFKNYCYLDKISELVLPKKWIIYNDKIVGFNMPYISGITLEEIIKNNLDNKYNIKEIFINLLNIINKFDELPFDFFLGDLHEKNIIIDNNGNTKIIDPDSYIINNEKLLVNGICLMGKYVNHFYNNDELMTIKKTADYYSLLCIILNYVFRDIIDDKLSPVTYLKKDSQFKGLYPLLDRVDDKFILLEEDINNIFNFKSDLNYLPKDNMDLEKEIMRIRRILKKES